MKITPSQIRGKKFKISLRGYDRKEVSKFLHSLADSCESLLKTNKDISQELNKLRKVIEDYQEKEERLENLLLSAQKSTQLINKSSQEKAELIVKEAEIKAERMISEEEKKLGKLREEILRLSQQKKLFLLKVKSLIKAHSELLNFYEEGPLENSSSSSSKSLPYPSPRKEKISFEE